MGTELRFIPLDPPLSTSLNLIWKKNQVHSNAASAFLRQLRKKIKS
ncbi:LysR family transcriptional regulator [Listeria floridensis FSL S10-1187]|uniref:LysR family transcriptional regulator n=1 Tax=Listeria floridensis FSL S10-1187 TaxID=1265817 RepID=A0ABP3B2H5_9LIST|nr:hypothetical protein [Listeria floridensis]EUJ33746.1 LysR family transcriptional regulator [Listeria floridensis FSL S10-1187]